MNPADARIAQLIVESSPAIALVLDCDGRIQYLNPFGEQLTGFKLAELRGRDWFDALLPPDERAGVRERFKAVIEGLPTRGGTNDLVTRGGRRRTIEWSSRRLVDAAGAPVGLLSSGTDVTERLAAEAALRERELGYRQLFEANPHAMWVYDLGSLRFLAVNAAALARYGYTREEFLAMGITDIRPAEDLPALWHNLAHAPAGLESAGTWRHRLKDGSLIEVEITSHPLDFEGRPAKMVLADDVTARRAAERQRDRLLAEARAAQDRAVAAHDLLRDVLGRVDDGFVALDREGHYTFVNARAAQLLGHATPEGLLGRTIHSAFPEELGQHFHAACEQALRSQQPIVLEEYYRPWERWFENRIYPSPDGLSVYFTDITLRKRAEQATQQSEQLLRHFFDSGLVGMAISVPSKRWGQFNHRLCEMLGYSAAQMQSLTWAEMTHPDDLPENLAQFESVMSGETDGYRMDKRYVRADGSVLSASIAVHCERDREGRPLRFFAIIEDIGARKRAEQAVAQHRDDLEREVQERTVQLVAARDEAERANRSKSAFLSRMSHELRTPLNAILGFGQLMALDTGATPQQQGFTDEILRAGRHLLELIDEVLDLARIESGRLALSVEALSLAELLDDCLRMTAPLADARRIAIDCAPADGIVLLADRTRLRQVLLNLLSNAVKYNCDGGRITIESAPQPGQRVRVSVTDTGPGIAPERLGQLFDPFDRLGQEFGTVQGTGIGLTIVRQLVELMGGEIGVDGRHGQGACFWIELPAASPSSGA